MTSTARSRCAPPSRPVGGERPSSPHRRPLGSGEACHRARPPRAGGRRGRRLPLRAAGCGPVPRREAAALRSRGLLGCAARRGQYRVIYSIHDDEVLVRVVRISHRADVYG
nr:type II toxin-antitoxin system RelE/ParE family toxin [Geodermatophilus sp. LHW52908]